jgi:nitroreductase
MNTRQQNAMDFILSRRSIRVFAPGPVTDDQVGTLLEAAMSAPSAMGRDPWRFVVIRDRETLDRMAEILPNGSVLSTAPVGIVACGDLDVAHDHQLSYLLQDCSAAVQNLLLAAHILGLGACWLGLHPREQRIHFLRELLRLPPSVIPIAGVALGQPGESKEPRCRYESEYVHYDRW